MEIKNLKEFKALLFGGAKHTFKEVRYGTPKAGEYYIGAVNPCIISTCGADSEFNALICELVD